MVVTSVEQRKLRRLVSVLIVALVVMVVVTTLTHLKYTRLVLEQLQKKLVSIEVALQNGLKLPSEHREWMLGQIMLNSNHAIGLLTELYPRLESDSQLQATLSYLYYPEIELATDNLSDKALQIFQERIRELRITIFTDDGVQGWRGAKRGLRDYFRAQSALDAIRSE